MSDNPRPIDYHAGDARPLDFPIYDENPLDPGEPDLTSPVDLSSASAIRFAVADDALSTAHFTKSLGSGITVETGGEGVDNIIRVTLAAANTEYLTPGRLYYEIDVTEAGDAWTGPHGEFKLEASLLK